MIHVVMQSTPSLMQSWFSGSMLLASLEFYLMTKWKSVLTFNKTCFRAALGLGLCSICGDCIRPKMTFIWYDA